MGHLKQQCGEYRKFWLRGLLTYGIALTILSGKTSIFLLMFSGERSYGVHYPTHLKCFDMFEILVTNILRRL